MVAQRLKRMPPMRETRVRSLGWKGPLEKEMVAHSSILATWNTVITFQLIKKLLKPSCGEETPQPPSCTTLQAEKRQAVNRPETERCREF